MNSTSVEKGANSQRFYGCAYNENETNVRKADGEIDEMYAKDVSGEETHTHILPRDDNEKLESPIAFTY